MDDESKESEWLAQAFKSMLQLQAVELDCDGIYGEPAIQSTELKLLSGLGQQNQIDCGIYRKPDRIPGEHTDALSRQFRSLLSAVYSARANLKSFKISAGDFKIFSEMEPEVLEKAKAVVSSVLHIELHFDWHFIYAVMHQELEGLGSFIGNAQSLRCLDICIHVPDNGYLVAFWQLADLTDLVRVRDHWPNFEVLKLQNIKAHIDHLCSFLMRHSKTLRCLHPRRIDLRGEPVDDTVGPYAIWTSAIEFLHEHLNLDSTRLYGNLTSYGSCALRLHDEEDCADVMKSVYSPANDCSYEGEGQKKKFSAFEIDHGPDSLQSRIEEYVLRGGEMPLDLLGGWANNFVGDHSCYQELKLLGARWWQ